MAGSWNCDVLQSRPVFSATSCAETTIAVNFPGPAGGWANGACGRVRFLVDKDMAGEAARFQRKLPLYPGIA